MRLFSFFALILCSNVLSIGASAQTKPKLVVNIVVSQLRPDVLESMANEFSSSGFNLLSKQGVSCTQSRYEFNQTTSLPALATLASGANPSVHGITADRWVERTTNQSVALTNDNEALGLASEFGVGNNSALNLVCPSLGDQLKHQNKSSKVVSIALEADESIVMGGFHASNYWMDLGRGTWISSSKFMLELPLWVSEYNSLRSPKGFINYDWKTKKQIATPKQVLPDYKQLLQTPAGNSTITDFAKQAVIYERLGTDDDVDLLNIYYQAPKQIISRYGYKSEQGRDMLLHLDQELGSLIDFITVQVEGRENVLFVLSSDHGTSEPIDNQEESSMGGAFNIERYRILANAFLNTQYCTGDWIVDFIDRQVYLNHNLIYNEKLSLEQVQEKLAVFTLQFGGVSQVMSSTNLQRSYWGGELGTLVQNGFYPKRSGDLIINLQPGWIEQHQDIISSSGSGYDYDRHVPLFFMGASLEPGTVDSPVDMTSLAPTLAYIMRIKPPIASSRTVIKQVTQHFNKK